MTTMYRPVLIESAEQAEALPLGTVAMESGDQGQTIGASIRVRGGWHITGEDTVDGRPRLHAHSEMVGDQVLEPIEAEEERTRPVPLYATTAHVSPTSIAETPARRLVTPWEESR